jgi:hypothetical protein
MKATREILRLRLSKEQYELARASISSGHDRLEFARFHYHEITTRWHSLLSATTSTDAAIDIVLHDFLALDDGVDHAEAFHAMGAHTLACVQSLHAIPDIFAHCLFYSLGYSTPLTMNEAGVNAVSVKKLLEKDAAFNGISAVLESLYCAGEFPYLNALANHSKHRSIIKNLVTADVTGTDPTPLRLSFQPFTFKGSLCDTREVLPVLESELNRMSMAMVRAGVELNLVLGIS